MFYQIIQQDQAFKANIAGDFTFQDHDRFRELLEKMAGLPQAKLVELYVKELNFIDSAGIGMLIIAHEQSHKNGQNLVVSGATGQVKMALEIADLKSLLTLRD